MRELTLYLWYSEFLKKQDEYYENYRNKKKKKKDPNSEEMKLDVNHLPYFYGSHYSNPTYISHYLFKKFLERGIKP